MSETTISELLVGRRYSAVAFRHPAVASFRDLTGVLGRGALDPLPTDVSGVSARRLELVHTRNLNPSGSSLRDVAAAGDSKASAEYRHWCMIGMLDGGANPVIVFAAPYLRIVDKWAVALRETFDAPKPSFVAPELSSLFDSLSSNPAELSTREIALQVSGMVGVKTVTLKGDSPLISSLRQRIGRHAKPYGIRLEIGRQDQRPLRVYVDRHGNFSWFQTSDRAFVDALRVFQNLIEDGHLKGTYDVPTRRVEESETFELW